mmetsp:Transcript_15319/g.22457  ORF Transcript_15319/g.22457 Transcript_15319/m.22457 type:complete len:90 (+) Transcript_15319:500-769(+)
MGILHKVPIPEKAKNVPVNKAYLTCTGSSTSLGAKHTNDFETPSAILPGHFKGLARMVSGKLRAHTAMLNAAPDPYAPINAARIHGVAA